MSFGYKLEKSCIHIDGYVSSIRYPSSEKNRNVKSHPNQKSVLNLHTFKSGFSLHLCPKVVIFNTKIYKNIYIYIPQNLIFLLEMALEWSIYLGTTIISLNILEAIIGETVAPVNKPNACVVYLYYVVCRLTWI